MNNNVLFSLRVREKLSVEELSSILDVPVERIRAWENEGKAPTAMELRKLAVFYNVSSDYLLGLEEQPVQKQQTTPVSQPQTYNQPQTTVAVSVEKKKREPIFGKDWYVAIPATILVMFILMACPFWEYYKHSFFEVTFQAGWAVGICALVFNAAFALYFFVILFLNKRNLAKFNIPNPIVLACAFVVNLILSICAITQSYGALSFWGVLLYIFWFGIALYCAFLAIFAVIKFNKSSETDDDAQSNSGKNKLLMSKQEKITLAKQRKIAGMTPGERQNRIQKASKVKIRPWLDIVPIVMALVFIVLALTVGVYSGSKTYFDFMFERNNYYFYVYLSFLSVIFITIMSVINMAVAVRLTKTMKNQKASLVSFIFNFINLAWSIVGICAIIGTMDTYGGLVTEVMSVYIIIFALAALYALVRMITCIVKYITCKKAEYLD